MNYKLLEIQSCEPEFQQHRLTQRQIAIVEMLEQLAKEHPHIYDLIDIYKVERCLENQSQELLVGAEEFLDNADGGRGSSYRQAQQNTLARAQGACTLLRYFLNDAALSATVLDVLGGDGLLTRIVRNTERMNLALHLITSDICVGMVKAARERGLPAICQPADDLVLRDSCLDGVLIAYGTHHLSLPTLIRACSEARRVLKSGGKLVLHDFEPTSGAAQWFTRVVHPYSRQGHDYPHYGVEILSQALAHSGFETIDAKEIADPIVAWGDTPAQAKAALSLYLYQMYGLVKLGDETSVQVQEKILHEAEACFGSIVLEESKISNGKFAARLQRVAAISVGVSTKETM